MGSLYGLTLPLAQFYFALAKRNYNWSACSNNHKQSQPITFLGSRVYTLCCLFNIKKNVVLSSYFADLTLRPIDKRR